MDDEKKINYDNYKTRITKKKTRLTKSKTREEMTRLSKISLMKRRQD